MWVRTRQQLKKIVSSEIILKGYHIALSTSVVCLGVHIVHIHPELTFVLHVKIVVA